MDTFIVRKIWRKIGKKYNHKYYNKGDKEIKDKKFIENAIKGVYIAPAYDNVKINLKKDEKVLAIGYDEKGRSQYVYNKKYTQSQSYKKFDKMITFGKNFNKINKKIDDDLYTVKDSKNKQIAIILKLIMECQFRIGNDVYSKKNKSYGTTTLQGKHMKIKKDEIIIDFNGKKNVRNICTIKNKKLVKTLKQTRRTIGKEDRIFTYRKGEKYFNIKSSDVNKYLKQFGKFTAKDFRTWGANIELIKQLMKNKKTELKDCIKNVSIKLHNTPAICKSNYLDPELMEFYKNDPEGFKKHFNFKTDTSLYNQYIQFLEEL
jgi:DNA topoisomerase I